MTNKEHAVLYSGVTSDLITRVWQHKNKIHTNSFSAKYNCNKLVYYQAFSHIKEAIDAEKSIKGGSRASKLAMINSINPEWNDMYDELIKESIV